MGWVGDKDGVTGIEASEDFKVFTQQFPMNKVKMTYPYADLRAESLLPDTQRSLQLTVLLSNG